MAKVLVVGNNFQVQGMFRERGWEIVRHFDIAELICFTGGEDVWPGLYDEPVHPFTHFNKKRDSAERSVFNFAVHEGVPCVGICRGGQFLNVMHGGKLWQHVEDHGIYGTHRAIRLDMEDKERVFNVTSTHHQMMKPADHGEVIMKADFTCRVESGHPGISMHTLGVEAVYYPHPTSPALCFQPHPEFPNNGDTRDVFFDMIDKYLHLKGGE